MSECGVSSTGTQLKYSTDGSTFTVIAGVTTFPEPSFTAETAECTPTADSASATRWREYHKTGVLDQGEVSFGLRWKPGNTSQTALFADLESNSARHFQLAFPDTDNTTLTFEAFVTGLTHATPDVESPDKVNQTITLRPTGEPTWG